MASAAYRGAGVDKVEAALRRLDRFAQLLDGMVGLIPGIGDGITAVAALYPVAKRGVAGNRHRAQHPIGADVGTWPNRRLLPVRPFSCG